MYVQKKENVMKNINAIAAAIITLFFSSMSMAGTSEVKWINPDDYRDVDAGEGHKAKFKAKVFADFEKHFEKLSAKLPEGQNLLVEVTDVDLAGDVNHGGMRRIRIVKDLYFPRIKFSYQLVDGKKQELSSGTVNLKDMSFMMGSSLRHSNDSLTYEKNMLDEWFSKTFLQ